LQSKQADGTPSLKNIAKACDIFHPKV